MWRHIWRSRGPPRVVSACGHDPRSPAGLLLGVSHLLVSSLSPSCDSIVFVHDGSEPIATNVSDSTPRRRRLRSTRSPPTRSPRPTKPAAGPFRFRLAEVGQSVPILTAVQDVAFDERMMLTEHNRRKAAVTATRVHAVANSKTARATRRTTARRLSRPVTRRAHQPVCEPRQRSWRPRRDHGVAILCPTTPTVCLVDRFDDGLDGQRGPPPRHNRFDDMLRPQHPVCSDLNNEATGIRVEPPTRRLRSRPPEMASREPAVVTVTRALRHRARRATHTAPRSGGADRDIGTPRCGRAARTVTSACTNHRLSVATVPAVRLNDRARASTRS